MKKLFLFLVCFCSLGCFAQVDEQKELFSYKFIEEKILLIGQDPPPPPTDFGVFLVKSEDNRIWRTSLNVLWVIYAFNYKKSIDSNLYLFSHFLYETLNLKRTINSEIIQRHTIGNSFKLSCKIRVDYDNLSFDEFRNKYTDKISENKYTIKHKYKGNDEIVWTIYYFLYINNGYIKQNGNINNFYAHFHNNK
ncbi:hypothetical protein [Capnocytophaga cynodegmi]|uniref:Lipoprotein n=1 Tax=Capnocytophaga cynodegmi TaxID=28189 RepID=A0A0B7H8C6_9FLAO|nr:hypothetical protein [Capnocytophaga cynodegmi]CEN35876.1 exported hypothetical protein [Capnocytophaga cynodegmi]